MTRKKYQPDIPAKLRQAFDAIESGLLDQIIRSRWPEEFDALRAVLTDPEVDERYRRKAIYALGRWNDRRAVADIRQVMPELNHRSCATAIDALGRLGGTESREAIEAYADDPEPQVRKFVVKALQRIGGQAATDQLKVMAKGDSREWLRDLAAGKRPATRPARSYNWQHPLNRRSLGRNRGLTGWKLTLVHTTLRISSTRCALER